MSAFLRVSSKQVVPLARSLSVGRDPHNDLVLDDPKVSRRHALFHQHNHSFWLTDFGSRNGVIVNGQPVRQPIVLQEGDKLVIGDTRLEFCLNAPLAAIRRRHRTVDDKGECPATLRMHDHFTPGDPAVILMDASLHVSQCSTAAGNMLRHYFGRTPEKRLPSAVTDWITRIRKHTPEGRSLDPFVVGSGSRRLIVRACFDNAVQPVLIVHEEETAFSPARLQQLGLSPRESDVMHWVAQGKTNGEIAQILSLSLGTVNKHVESSLRKLGVENRNQALLLLLDRLGTLVRA